TVVLGVLCLLASHTPTTRSLGVAASFGIVVAFVFGTFVLPGALLWFGRWIFWPRSPRVGDTTEHRVFDAVGGAVKKTTRCDSGHVAVCARGNVAGHVQHQHGAQSIRSVHRYP